MTMNTSRATIQFTRHIKTLSQAPFHSLHAVKATYALNQPSFPAQSPAFPSASAHPQSELSSQPSPSNQLGHPSYWDSRWIRRSLDNEPPSSRHEAAPYPSTSKGMDVKGKGKASGAPNSREEMKEAMLNGRTGLAPREGVDMKCRSEDY